MSQTIAHQLASGVGILAAGLVQHDGLDRRMRGKPFMHLQAGCAGSAVDEDAIGHCGVINAMVGPCKAGYSGAAPVETAPVTAGVAQSL